MNASARIAEARDEPWSLGVYISSFITDQRFKNVFQNFLGAISTQYHRNTGNW
jgi:hypothetical protein